jgi:hypothetical protein
LAPFAFQPCARKGELIRVARHFERRLAQVVNPTAPRAEAKAAQERLEESRQSGKIVIEI